MFYKGEILVIDHLRASAAVVIIMLHLKPVQTEKIVPYYLVARCAIGVELIVEETEAVNQLESRSRCQDSILVPGVETCWMRRSAQRKILGLYYVDVVHLDSTQWSPPWRSPNEINLCMQVGLRCCCRCTAFK